MKLSATGRKYEHLVVCPSCRPRFQEAVDKRDVEYNQDCAAWREANREADRYRSNWDRVNPRPKIPTYNTTEVWIRRITCGCCGKDADQEFKLSQTPGTVGWPWLLTKKHGIKVCPDCYDLPEHVALRKNLEELDRLRDEQVGKHYREAEKLRPAWQYPELPGPLRLTERIKRWFGF